MGFSVPPGVEDAPRPCDSRDVPDQSDVTFEADGGWPMRASLALPDDVTKPVPAVLVIHEIFGLNDDIRRIARRFADNGYAALAPDLYDRQGARLLCVARTILAMKRGCGTAFRDLERARRFLASRDEVDGERIGMAGFCMGGGFVMLLAVGGEYRAAAPFYGDVQKDVDDLRGSCPVVGSFGARDRIFAPHGRRLKRHLATLGTPHDVKIYDGVGHSFMSQHEPSVMDKLNAVGPMKIGYDENAAEDAWKRMLGFFGEHVAGSAEPPG